LKLALTRLLNRMIIAKNLSGADIGWAFVDVRFTPKSGHCRATV
jgi:hypothetical protein